MLSALLFYISLLSYPFFQENYEIIHFYRPMFTLKGLISGNFIVLINFFALDSNLWDFVKHGTNFKPLLLINFPFAQIFFFCFYVSPVMVKINTCRWNMLEKLHISSPPALDKENQVDLIYKGFSKALCEYIWKLYSLVFILSLGLSRKVLLSDRFCTKWAILTCSFSIYFPLNL